MVIKDAGKKKDKNRPKSLVSVDTDSGISSSNSMASLDQNTKDVKDTVNQQKQQGSVNEIHILPVAEKLAEFDKEGERTETEPLQSQGHSKVKGARSRSSSQKASEGDGKVVPKAAPASSHKGNGSSWLDTCILLNALVCGVVKWSMLSTSVASVQKYSPWEFTA